MSNNTKKSLQDVIDSVPNLRRHFYNETRGGDFSPSTFIPSAFTNWRDEQQAWKDSVALLHQSHHMTDTFIEGPDALRFLERFGVNSMKKFPMDRAKQYVACSPNGHLIGDGILHRLDDEKFQLVGTSPVHNWLMYQAEVGDYDLQISQDWASLIDSTENPENWRFQLAGPNAVPLLEAVIDEPQLSDIKFFHTAQVTIRGCNVLAHGHSMSGQGFELSGPFEDEQTVRDAILEVGKDFGVTPVGTDAYFTAHISSGWLSSPIPAIFTDSRLKSYRQWLPADSFEATTTLGGSFVSDNMEDYYFNPYDVGYGGLVKFDHDFVGREALENLPDEKKREKVQLVWDRDDVRRVFASQFGDGPRYKSLEEPLTRYSRIQYDEVRNWKGEFAGVSADCGYVNPVGEFLSIAVLDPKFSEPGTQVELTWGEPNGGSSKLEF